MYSGPRSALVAALGFPGLNITEVEASIRDRPSSLEVRHPDTEASTRPVA